LVVVTADFDLLCSWSTIVEVDTFVSSDGTAMSVVISDVRSGADENATDADLLFG